MADEPDRLRQTLEYLEGAHDRAPAWWPAGAPVAVVLWGLWWAGLGLTILVASGQTSKFIYIDF